MSPHLLLLLIPLCICEVIPLPRRAMSPNDKLLFVQVVWRHGDRAPTMTYPTDEHQENAWPNGWGELTQLGMRQQFALGRLIRSRYMLNETTKPLLSSRYNSKEVYVRSTDVNRTLISAYSNIAGMYSEGHRGEDFPDYIKWPSNWTPVPVHTVDLETDHIGNIFAPCPRAEELDDALRSSKEFLKLQKDNQDFLDFISEKTGMKVDLTNLYLINDVHHIEMIYNKSQPDWMTPEISHRLLNLTQQANEYTYGISEPYVPEMIRLRGGSMLKALIQKMNHKYSCYTRSNAGKDCSWMGPLKYYAYSAHDTTVAALLTTFGDELDVIRGGLPKYTASVAIELWDLEQEGPAVKLMFHTAFHHKYHPITQLTHGCPRDSEFCPLKTFERRSAKFVPNDIEKECRKQKNAKGNRHRLVDTNRFEWKF